MPLCSPVSAGRESRMCSPPGFNVHLHNRRIQNASQESTSLCACMLTSHSSERQVPVECDRYLMSFFKKYIRGVCAITRLQRVAIDPPCTDTSSSLVPLQPLGSRPCLSFISSFPFLLPFAYLLAYLFPIHFYWWTSLSHRGQCSEENSQCSVTTPFGISADQSWNEKNVFELVQVLNKTCQLYFLLLESAECIVIK